MQCLVQNNYHGHVAGKVVKTQLSIFSLQLSGWLVQQDKTRQSSLGDPWTLVRCFHAYLRSVGGGICSIEQLES